MDESIEEDTDMWGIDKAVYYKMESGHMIDVPYICQNPDYPTGCESVSVVMVLKYWGYDISVDDFIDNYLPQQGCYYVDGILHGGNPYKEFVGDPRTVSGFGCYAPVIEKALWEIMYDKETVLTTGSKLEDLCHKYIDMDIPVLIWASMDMEATREGRSWMLDSGEEFTWIAGEHCLVLVGYDDKYYYFNDPIAGENTAYRRNIVEERYKELGEQSLVIK